MGILVTFVPPKVTARRGMSDMPIRGTAAPPEHSGMARLNTKVRKPRQSNLHRNHPAVCGRHPSKEGNRAKSDLKFPSLEGWHGAPGWFFAEILCQIIKLD